MAASVEIMSRIRRSSQAARCDVHTWNVWIPRLLAHVGQRLPRLVATAGQAEADDADAVVAAGDAARASRTRASRSMSPFIISVC